VLLVIDPTDDGNVLRLAEANVEQARANALNARLELQRRQKLDELAEMVEDRQIQEAAAAANQAQFQATPEGEIRPRSVSNARRSARLCRGTTVANAQPIQQRFQTSIRPSAGYSLRSASRGRIDIRQVPEGVGLVTKLTATAEVGL